MKNNHQNLMSSIVNSINECGYDNALLEVKNLLKLALTLTQKIGKKRNLRETILEEMKAKALKKQEEWWEIIKKNAANEEISP